MQEPPILKLQILLTQLKTFCEVFRINLVFFVKFMVKYHIKLFAELDNIAHIFFGK